VISMFLAAHPNIFRVQKRDKKRQLIERNAGFRKDSGNLGRLKAVKVTHRQRRAPEDNWIRSPKQPNFKIPRLPCPI
jgi:hypothetical protein